MTGGLVMRTEDADGGASRIPTDWWVSSYSIPRMDCPADERLVRLALSGLVQIRKLSFDLTCRQLRVLHEGGSESVLARLETLGLGATIQQSVPIDSAAAQGFGDLADARAEESGTLRLLLAINAILFGVELTAGLLSQSTGLISESLDNFADAAVYGLSLCAVGLSVRMQVRSAHVAGVLQMILAVGALVEVIRRFLFGSEPESIMMIAIACIALVANTCCLLLLSKHREGGAHMKASWIFSANDVLINVGVIAAGGLVAWTGSRYPDLIIGAITGCLVLIGARRILALRG
jgi:hypothetical protein